MLKVGIVGYGYAGRGIHSYLVQQTSGLQLAAVVATSEEKRLQAQKEYGVKTYSRIEDLLKDPDIDLVIIATPHYLHAPQAILTLQAGKHCVIDKVMCMTSSEAIAIIEAAEKNRVLLSVFQNRRWDWDFLTLKKALSTRLIGEPFRFESRASRYRPPKQIWRTQKTSMGGILFDWGSHLIDQALQLITEPLENIYCHISNRYWPIDIGTHCQLILTFANDIVFEIEISYLCCAKRPRWTVLGTEGAITQYGLDPQEAAILAGDLNQAVENPENKMQITYVKNAETFQQPFDTVRGSWVEYYQNIAEVIQGKAELIVKPRQVLQQILILEAAMQSALTGKIVSNLYR
ncbi:MAG: Gfo/Idh/MocA family oxidoreductase [Proteobacteria bacterium]|nr:Gfo/Idh/MocA family oxidoreductase [Pseudomonadota bacterium]